MACVNDIETLELRNYRVIAGFRRWATFAASAVEGSGASAAGLCCAFGLAGCADVGLFVQGGRPVAVAELGSLGYTMDPTFLSICLRVAEADLRSPASYRLEAVARQQGGGVISVTVYELPWTAIPWGPPELRLSAGVSVPNVKHGLYRIVDETSHRVLGEVDTRKVAASAMLSSPPASTPAQ